MSRHLPEHPKKGSAEAYEWAERMRQARQKKARTKARVREAGQLTEMQFFGPGGSLEVKPKRMRNNLYRACAWCKKSLGEVAPYADKNTTHGICPTCLKKELSKTSKKNPGARYHEDAARIAGRYRKDAATNTERGLYAGMEIAHKDSAKAARSMKMNPSMKSSRWLVTRLKDGAQMETSYEGASHYYGKQGYDVMVLPPKKKRIKKNPIAIYNPPAPKVAGVIYNKAIEIRAKKTGSDLAGKYKHVFGKNVKILGLDNGDVVIHHTGGKRLWISRKDYERSGGKHE